MTVLEGIQKSAEFLAKKSVEPPRLHAELLLAHLLKMPRMKLYLNFERALTPAEVDALRELVRRRGLREPLQHITGSTSFCGLEIAVSRHVLIPRPETELLAEAGWNYLSTINRPRLRHRQRLHRGCAGGKMSRRKNFRARRFSRRAGAGPAKCGGKPGRQPD